MYVSRNVACMAGSFTNVFAMNSACMKWWEQIVHLIWAWSALLSVKWNAVRSTHNFYLTAKSIKPAVLSKRPLRAHSSAWSSISTSNIEDQLLYNIGLLYGFSQRVFVVLKGCWATFGVMYLDYLTWRYSHRILSEAHQHGSSNLQTSPRISPWNHTQLKSCWSTIHLYRAGYLPFRLPEPKKNSWRQPPLSNAVAWRKTALRVKIGKVWC